MTCRHGMTGTPGQTPKSIVGQVVGGTVGVAGPAGCRLCRCASPSDLEFLCAAPAAQVGGDPSRTPESNPEALALGSRHELENVKRGASISSGDTTATFCSAPWTAMCWSAAVISLPLRWLMRFLS